MYLFGFSRNRKRAAIRWNGLLAVAVPLKFIPSPRGSFHMGEISAVFRIYRASKGAGGQPTRASEELAELVRLIIILIIACPAINRDLAGPTLRVMPGAVKLPVKVDGNR